MQSLLYDVEVWSANLELGVERAITFDTTVGSPSYFYTSFHLPYFLVLLVNCFSVTRRSCRPSLSNRVKGAITFDLTLGSHFIFLHVFP